MKKIIKIGLKWSMPETNRIIIDTYTFKVPKGINPYRYLWIGTGMRFTFKTQCFINRMNKRKNFLFKAK